MSKPIYIFINGILTFPGSAKNWTGRAVTWIHTHSNEQAEKVEYWCGPISRAFGQKERADKLEATLSYYRDRKVTLVGHSNGCAVILAMMRDYGRWPNIANLHLVNAACESDFNVNGLNRLLGENRIGNVLIYIAGHDNALSLAKSWPAHLLGYGILGLHGPLRVLPSIEPRVLVMRMAPWSEYDHSDCWNDVNFDSTMDNFLPAVMF